MHTITKLRQGSDPARLQAKGGQDLLCLAGFLECLVEHLRCCLQDTENVSFGEYRRTEVMFGLTCMFLNLILPRPPFWIKLIPIRQSTSEIIKNAWTE